MADRIFIGAALDVPQIDTVGFSGMATGAVVRCACDHVHFDITAGTSMDTDAEFARGFCEAFNAEGNTTDYFDQDMTITRGGYEFGQFRDATATYSGSTVYLTGIPGRPFVFTVSKQSGTGTVTHTNDGSGSSQSATGSKFTNNADNYADGTVPVDGDGLVCSDGNASLWFALDQIAENVTIKKRNSHVGSLGLPDSLYPIDTTHDGFHYRQYREPFLTAPFKATSGAQAHEIGDSSGYPPAQGSVRLNMGTGGTDPSSLSVIIYDAPSFSDSGPGVTLVGGVKVGLNVFNGGVEVGTLEGEDATELTLLTVHDGADVVVGPNTTFKSGGAVSQLGGESVLQHDATSVQPDLMLYGGTCTQQSAVDDADIYGNLILLSGASATIEVFTGGVYDATNAAFQALASIKLYRGATWLDRNGRLTASNGYVTSGCHLGTDGGLTFTAPDSKTWTPS